MFFPRREFLKLFAWLTGSKAAGIDRAIVAPAALTPDAKHNAPTRATRANTNVEAIDIPGMEKLAFDLVVVGGGLSGTAAAISAARNGVKVAGSKKRGSKKRGHFS